MKRAVIGMSVLVVSLLLATSGVQAKATKTPFTFTAADIALGEPEREWVDDEGILHVRNQAYQFVVSGDFDGTLSGLVNVNMDLATGDGDGFGTLLLAVTGGGGTFEGRFTATFEGGAISGEFVGHGTGDFEGMKIMGTFAPAGPPPAGLNFEGIVLDPHGA